AHRPYHRAMAHDEAIATLRGEAGKALDPSLVALFIEILPRTDEMLQLEKAAPAVPMPDRANMRNGAPATGFFVEADGDSMAGPASVYQSISQATQEMHALYDIAQALGTRLSVHDTMGLLTSRLNRLVPASCWALYLPENGRDTMRCCFASGLSADVLEGLRLQTVEGASSWAARHKTAVVNARASSDFEAAGAAEAGKLFQSAPAYPLINGGQLVGTLTAYHVDAAPYSDAHRRLLDRLCGQAASVLSNSILFEGMRAASLTDSLTDLPNSRALVGYMDQRLEAEEPAPSALIMIDVDGFKAINDQHGHHAGDRALQAVAETLRRQVRSGDLCSRYGGDEFVVSMACQDRTEAERRAHDLQRAVARLTITLESGAAISVAISVGVAVCPDDGATFDELLASADRRMYENKQQRRAPEKPGSNLRLAVPAR